MTDSPGKAELRDLIWDRLVDAAAVRPPGAHGHIPNHGDARAAAARLAAHPWFREARTLKCNPDTPHQWVREAALQAGKTVYMAVPRLTTPDPFLRIEGSMLDPDSAARAATRAGARRYGIPVTVTEVSHIDMVVVGCVGVTPTGDRLGKGAGYADIEWGLLTATGAIDDTTRTATTVHALQLVAAIPTEPHDFGLDLIALADRVIETGRTGPRPRGIGADLAPVQRRSIPALRAWGAAAPPGPLAPPEDATPS